MRILPRATAIFNLKLTLLEWIVLIGWSIFMVITEGYRGFQKQFSPRFAARTWHLVNHGKPVDLILAPLYCMGYFHATKKRMLTSWLLTAGIALLIIIVSFMPQPWRGIVDWGVLAGLLYGLFWVYVFIVRVVKSRSYIVDPEIS